MTNLSHVAFAKVIADRWRALPEAERREYEERALQDKPRYEREKRAYKGD